MNIAVNLCLALKKKELKMCISLKILLLKNLVYYCSIRVNLKNCLFFKLTEMKIQKM